MNNRSYFLPGFHLQLLRRASRSAAQKLAEERERIHRLSLSELGNYFQHLIPSERFSQQANGAFSRRRIFSKANTFWAFFSQILDADGGCQEVLRKIQAVARAKGVTRPSSSTSAYCQSRQKLDARELETILKHTTDRLEHQTTHLRWHGHRVVVVDGTGLSMPDTPANQEHWPQQRSQTPGCGFPQMTVCACFNLHSGALLSYRTASRKRHELPLLREQWDTFKPGDILLADKGFCSYYDVWQAQQKGIDSVFTLARRTPVEAASAVETLGADDLLIRWPKPKWNAGLSYTKDVWDRLPDGLMLRQIHVKVEEPGFRTQGYYLITTLLDEEIYSASDLANLYRQRWEVELFFRDLKTTLGMDILRCRTPEMIQKELLMHWIVYNALRYLMLRSGDHTALSTHRLSFKASLQALRQWDPHLNRARLSPQKRREMMNELCLVIADSVVLERAGRREPRCLKRRPKPYAIMTKIRLDMQETPHRSRYRAKAA